MERNDTGLLADTGIVNVGDTIVMTRSDFETVKERHIMLGMRIQAEVAELNRRKSTLLSVKQVAKRMNRSEATVRRWVAEGHPRIGSLDFIVEGNAFLITEYDLDIAIARLKK